MASSSGSSSPVILREAQLYFKKDSLRIQASFIPQIEIVGDLHAALELGIRNRKMSAVLRLGPFETEQTSGRIELDREIDIKRIAVGSLAKGYPLKALDEIKLILGDYGKFKSLELFSPLCTVTFTRENKRWS